ncbi:MAG TPA: queuosine precursor transporter [Phycisphaerae bacterium]|nr:queuosine precursor transporter [Phycisphaerae bacterium]
MAEGSFDRVHLTSALHERRERVFVVLAGIFLGSMAMLNILGITRFIHIGPLALAVGVLPYPLTFLCTDFISEFYGRRRANFVVWVGFLLNLIVLAFLWLGHQFPGISESARPGWQPEGSWNPPAWQTLRFAAPLTLPFGDATTRIDLFEAIYRCTRAAVFASMIAYLAAQFCDVFMFHFWKKLTKGKHLWLRNNGSTMISQLVDSTAVIFITFWAAFTAGKRTLAAMLVLVASSYLFKFVVAALDTVPFYIGVKYLGRYLQIDPTTEHDADTEPVGTSGPSPAKRPASGP